MNPKKKTKSPIKERENTKKLLFFTCFVKVVEGSAQIAILLIWCGGKDEDLFVLKKEGKSKEEKREKREKKLP